MKLFELLGAITLE